MATSVSSCVRLAEQSLCSQCLAPTVGNAKRDGGAVCELVQYKHCPCQHLPEHDRAFQSVGPSSRWISVAVLASGLADNSKQRNVQKG